MPFTTLGLGSKLSQALKEKGYVEPTPIQAKAIPVILSGRDVIGVAQTGTGKTAAFVLPLLEQLAAAPAARTMRALVIAPTRELVAQIEENVRAYGRHLPLRYATIFGGVGEGPQIQALRRGVDLVVATPGRLIDLMEQRHVDFAALRGAGARRGGSHARHGFPAGDPEDRLEDATVPADAAVLGDDVERDRECDEGSTEVARTRRDRRALDARRSGDAIRRRSLARRQGSGARPPAARTPRSSRCWSSHERSTAPIASGASSSAAGIPTATLHSNRTQGQRLQALKRFRSGDVRVLIATDIAARGIDVDGISHVINFDFPPQPEDYVHRIGRTGRAQAIGDAISFVTHEDADSLRKLERFLGRGITRKKLDGYVPPSQALVRTLSPATADKGPSHDEHAPQHRRPKGAWQPKGPRSGSFGPKRFGQRRGQPQGRRGRT